MTRRKVLQVVAAAPVVGLSIDEWAAVARADAGRQARRRRASERFKECVAEARECMGILYDEPASNFSQWWTWVQSNGVLIIPEHGGDRGGRIQPIGVRAIIEHDVG